MTTICRPPLHHPFPEPPATAVLQDVAPGVRWLRMPLPYALDHINLWVLDDGDDAVTLVDTGVGNDATRALWEQILAGPLAGCRVSSLICTHFHPDHMGLAGWLAQRDGGIPVRATLAEWSFGRMLSLDQGQDYIANQITHYEHCGYDAEMLESVRARANTFRPRVAPLPPVMSRIRHGDALTVGAHQWDVIVGEGHSPEHACLWCADLKVLIAGDQVLPRISPLVGVWAQEPEANPLALFLASMNRLRPLPEETLVLPSHGLPFIGLHSRMAEIAGHHHDRLDNALAACKHPSTVLEIQRHLFRRHLDAFQTDFATGETLAHLNYLWHSGALSRETGADRCWRFQRIVAGAPLRQERLV